MALKFRPQHRPPFLHRASVPHRLEPFVQLTALLAKLLPAGLTTDDELSPSAAVAEMGKAQKVEGVRPTLFAPRLWTLVPAKANHASLFRVQRQIELRKSLPYRLQYAPGILLVLRHADEIIRVTHQRTDAANLPLDTLFKPQVQHIMQEDVGKHRA